MGSSRPFERERGIGLLGLLLILVAIAALVGLLVLADPIPELADPSFLGPCSLPPSSGPPAPTRDLRPSDSEGIVRLVSAELPARTTIELTGPLRIETDNELVIRGTITFGDRSVTGTAAGGPRSLELISRNGVVTIATGAQILGGQECGKCAQSPHVKQSGDVFT